MGESWWSHPAVQAGFAPFAVALLWGLLTWRHERLPAWGGVLGFALTVLWVADLNLFPMTSTRKIIWGIVVAAVFAGLCQRFCPPRRLLRNLWWVFAAGVALWVVWPAIRYQGGWAGAVLGTGAVVYAAVQVAVADALRGEDSIAALHAWMLALASGLVCLLGSSAFLGQLGLGLGSAALAVWLVMLLRGGLEGDAPLVLPVAAGAAWLGVAGLAYAQVPWPALFFLAWVGLVQWLPVPLRFARGGEWAYRVGLSAVPALLAVAWTGFSEGLPPL